MEPLLSNGFSTLNRLDGYRGDWFNCECERWNTPLIVSRKIELGDHVEYLDFNRLRSHIARPRDVSITDVLNLFRTMQNRDDLSS